MTGTDAGGRRRFRPGLASLRVRLAAGFLVVALTTGLAAVVLALLAFVVYQRGFDLAGGTAWQAAQALILLLVATVILLTILAIGLALLAAGRVLRPVRRLADAAERMARGQLDVRLPVTGTDELSELVATFNEMATSLQGHVEQLRRMEAQSRRFVADVSHELRSPLAAMTAVTDVLDDEADQLHGRAGTAARLVSRETRNLNRLVDDLIEISQLDAGTAALRLDDVHVAAALRGCLQLRGWLDQVTTDVPEGVVTRLDRRRFDVVTANLVGNALRHGAAPVTVSLQIANRQGQAWLVLAVGDRGPGLPPEVLPHVFDRFVKADTARPRSTGSGLGLAIAMANARLHGGDIVAANRPDGGAVFTLWLPAYPPARNL